MEGENAGESSQKKKKKKNKNKEGEEGGNASGKGGGGKGGGGKGEVRGGSSKEYSQVMKDIAKAQKKWKAIEALSAP